MDRREFIGWISVSALANSLPVVLASCSVRKDKPQNKQENPKIDKNSRKNGFLVLGTVQDLNDKGILRDNQNAAKPVLIVRNPDNINLSAVNPTCTHQGCTVEWKTDTKIFACPCHGSKFSSDGKVLGGPAKKPLESFQAKEEDGLVLVKAI
ncbi:MAG: ubiquinol-cytochrome c reductase iron-sulfur subunit [Stigonema ocellatum SAG 48.90 = DSM 106950]|nr:ubiquinol-cytochrome c reductase iron-sulfur subunit [Stigonema ocellatum SAG 48.90 = DSM 106950]